MTSATAQILTARIERFPIAGTFTISRGAKTEAVTVVAEVSRNGFTGRGECVPYPRYGETPEATLAALQAMQDAISGGLDRTAPPSSHAARRGPQRPGLRPDRSGGQAGRVACLEPARTVPPRGAHHRVHNLVGYPRGDGRGGRQGRAPALLKIKLGGDGDAARIAAVRKAVPESELIVDANEAWTVANLEQNLAACADVGVTLVEQPLPAGRDEALARIKRPLSVCADESVHDRNSLRPAPRPL